MDVQEVEVHKAPRNVGNQQITLSTLAPKVLTSLGNGTKALHANASQNYVDVMLHSAAPSAGHQLTSNTSQEHHELITMSAVQGQPPNTPGHKRSKSKKDVIFQSVAGTQALLGDWMAQGQLNLSCPESPNRHHYKLDHF